MLNSVIIDDEPLAILVLEEFCKKIPYLKVSKSFTDTNDAAKYLKGNQVDLVFLDIEMPSINGIDFCRNNCKEKMVIFTTAYSNFAVFGFELDAIDYILKPIEFSRFFQAVEKAQQHSQLHFNPNIKSKSFLFVKSNYNLVKIAFAEINFIESQNDYVKIYIQNKEPIKTKITISAILEQLNEDEFIRVHRSFVVPLSKIEYFKGKKIVISETEIPIGLKFEKQLFEKFNLKK